MWVGRGELGRLPDRLRLLGLDDRRAFVISDTSVWDRHGATVAQSLDEAAVRAHCDGLVADYMVPDHVTFVAGSLPRNANGKLRKDALRAASRGGLESAGDG